MLPKSHFILDARVADKLSEASVAAVESGWREAGGVVYARENRLSRVALLENKTDQPGIMMWESKSLSLALSNPPNGFRAVALFHSHPLSELPGTADVASTPRGKKALLFDCVTCEFSLFHFSRKIRAASAKPLADFNTLVNEGRLPLYVETGIEPLDTSIITGVRHPSLVSKLHSELCGLLKDTFLSNHWQRRALSLDQRRRRCSRLSRLDRFFHGLEYYLFLADRTVLRPRRRMKSLTETEEEFLLSAAGLQVWLDSYLESFEDCKADDQGVDLEGWLQFAAQKGLG